MAEEGAGARGPGGDADPLGWGGLVREKGVKREEERMMVEAG